MSLSLERIFRAHLNAIQIHLEAAANSENPALFLFKNNARTPLFYLEAITKVMSKMNDQKYWSKWKSDFKELEDGLGQIDYWFSFYNETNKNKKFPREINTYFHNQFAISCHHLNETLLSRSWIWYDSTRLNKILKKVSDLEWIEDADFISFTTKFYYKSIEKIEESLISDFKDIECDIHELRREIRWLSIIPQALPGFFILKNDKPCANYKNYLTENIVKSPYNILKENKAIKDKLVFNKSAFLALSWLIYTIGTYKDLGQKIEAYTNAYKKTFAMNQSEIEEELSVLFKNQPSIDEILSNCSDIANQFHEENILENLISI